MAFFKKPIRLTSVRVLAHLLLQLFLSDGSEVVLNCSPLVHSGLSLELLDPDTFAAVKVASDGGLVWPNGYWVSPELLADLIG